LGGYLESDTCQNRLLMRIQAQRGTEDVLPSQVAQWQRLEETYRRVAHVHGYREIRTPVFEDVALFKRTAGETSDIVSKEMYEFKDKGDRDIALKPEGTAPAIRAVLEHNLCPQGTHTRLYYMTACYRYGRPAKGRLRELHQFGAELIGASSAEADAEIIELAFRYFSELGLGNDPISINSIGLDECRGKYSEVILTHMSAYLKGAELDVQARIQKNPLGLLDTKDAAQREALNGLPSILDYLEDSSKARFDKLQLLLTEAGVKYRVAPEVVRGLDYYTETVFEFESLLVPGLSLFGGGRYDNLVKQLGGPPTPCVGFGIGVERLLLALEAAQNVVAPMSPEVFVVRATESAGELSRSVVRSLRSSGISVMLDIDSRSMKSQMRQADGSGAKIAIILGDDEVAGSHLTIKNLENGEQKTVSVESALAEPRLSLML
jgi:histidyl-tRNA synthetase